MTNNTPLVSVLIPTYNRPEFASGRKQRFDGFASENEERSHRLQTSG